MRGGSKGLRYHSEGEAAKYGDGEGWQQRMEVVRGRQQRTEVVRGGSKGRRW